MEWWKEIREFPGYEISDRGAVMGKKSKRLLKFNTITGGYQLVRLYKNKKQYSFLVHRLVLQFFRGPCPVGLEAAHLDGNPKNNHVDNLTYLSPQENCLMKRDHGTMYEGERNHFAKLTEKEVLEIRRICRPRDKKHGYRPLAKKYNVHERTIWWIVSGRGWKSLLPEEATQ